MTGTVSFTEAVREQTTVMLKIAERLDEKGYAVVVNGLNNDARHGDWLYPYISGGLTTFLRNCRAVAGPVIVLVQSTDKDQQASVRATRKVFDHPFQFQCSIPNRVPYRPINAALGLLSRTRDYRRRSDGVKGCGPLICTRLTDRYEYFGNTKEALGILLRILEMPHHRAIMLNPKSRGRDDA